MGQAGVRMYQTHVAKGLNIACPIYVFLETVRFQLLSSVTWVKVHTERVKVLQGLLHPGKRKQTFHALLL